MKITKWILGITAASILMICFMLGIMDGIVREDQMRDKQRREICDQLPWPRPAACAALGEKP